MTEPVKLTKLNIVVSDMAASVAFYRLLGVEIGESAEPYTGHHRSATMAGGIDLDLESSQFASKWDPGWRGGLGVIGFEVDSREAVDERFATLTAAGYRAQLAPIDAFWGARYAIVEDPDGNPVSITSPPDDAMRSAPIEP